MVVLNADFHVAQVEKMPGTDLVMKSHSNVSHTELWSTNLYTSLTAGLINSAVLLNSNSD